MGVNQRGEKIFRATAISREGTINIMGSTMMKPGI